MSESIKYKFSKEELIKKLNMEILDYAGRLEALKNVKRIYKKDGKPFANISKNYENCTISTEGYGHDLRVDFTNCSHPYNHYTFNITISAKDMTDEEKAKHQVSDKDFYGNPSRYIMNCDEIDAEIKRQIEMAEEYLKCTREALDQIKEGKVHLVEALEQVKKEYNELDDIVWKKRNESGTYASVESTIYYLLYDYLS